MAERRNLLITGASDGIGAETAKLAAARGYNIGIGYRTDKKGAEETARAAEALGAKTVLLHGDISVEADIQNVFATFTSELGQLDALVNNAGIVGPSMRVEDMSRARLDQMFAVNTIGPMQCAQTAVRLMAHRYGGKGGVIVNVSSVAALLGSPNEYADYAAAKAALDAFTIGLAKENAREGIRVNAVRPGVTRTKIHAKGGEEGREDRIAPMVPMGRPGEAQEIAEAILYLLSDASSYMTGSFLDVTGGR
ncbi:MULTISPECIES: SDR family oxidoreductase [Halocynthiibacter]|uniref:SDR family oxidoreductase n=1 Tax=Halocynthiibacter halioticoli TaxID=2986804 RepID=A0AAE3IZU2_9RHOB|nr:MULTISPECIES: SDR family oxidoreductase [Halocynthiibacter]MCV6824734.1 SDR family oxidoreductase [Halocynthiibacter halioticoli]MCW4057735.1 SDR family oxidoreductase [Halocynthiibacter sp. SDUM655004]